MTARKTASRPRLDVIEDRLDYLEKTTDEWLQELTTRVRRLEGKEDSGVSGEGDS